MRISRAKRLIRIWRVFFCLFCWLSGIEAWAQPHLVVDQPVWNFGRVTNVVGLEHDFVISNSGDAPLEIQRVVSSCNSCLLADIGKNKILPGDSTLLRGRLDLRRLDGEVDRAILVDCNDPTNPSITLQVAVTMVPAYLITPTAAMELDLSKGEQTKTAQIQPLLKLHADLSQVNCEDSNLVATLGPGSSDGTALTVTVKPTVETGDTLTDIIIHSSNSNDLPCQMTVLIHNPPDVEIVPWRLKFQAKAEPQTQTLWLKQHGISPLTLLDAVPSADNYHCEIDPNPNGFDYRINVTAWQQQLSAGKTNLLTLKIVDSKNQDKSVVVPLLVEEQ